MSKAYVFNNQYRLDGQKKPYKVVRPWNVHFLIECPYKDKSFYTWEAAMAYLNIIIAVEKAAKA